MDVVTDPTVMALATDTPASGNDSAATLGLNFQRFTESRSFRMTLAKLVFVTAILAVILYSHFMTNTKGFREQWTGYVYKSLSVFLITKGLLSIFDLLFNVDYGLLEFIVDPFD